ncbi:MAG: glycosyltransferase involved in cell wall biosynthesis [Paraglaciecola psychrophila]|jgi:glycosyltransferase involved in cell wall biosynthesis
MKLIVTANIVPFMPGGADNHITGLTEQLRAHGHEVELIRFPFRFSPEADIERLMDFCQRTSLQNPNGVAVDKVISLQFPAYGVQHDNHTVWLMHQHRAVYELFDEVSAAPGVKAIRNAVVDFDTRNLSGAKKLFANSQRVADRLKQFNGLTAQPLYHPPAGAESFYCGEDQGYIFCPSRLERLKRQDLLIQAAAHLRSPVKILIGGDGGQRRIYQQMIQDLNVQDKVRLIGRFTDAEKMAYYARSLAVFFGPFDEDYGYITLEAMLSSKPVISCDDSGGPLEFVRNQETGFIVAPEPELIAEKIDWLYYNRPAAADMGRAGLEAYKQHRISWQHVVDSLLNS